MICLVCAIQQETVPHPRSLDSEAKVVVVCSGKVTDECLQ